MLLRKHSMETIRNKAMGQQGTKLPEGLRACGDLAVVADASELLLMVVPTPFVARTVEGIADRLRPTQVP